MDRDGVGTRCQVEDLLSYVVFSFFYRGILASAVSAGSFWFSEDVLRSTLGFGFGVSFFRFSPSPTRAQNRSASSNGNTMETTGHAAVARVFREDLRLISHLAGQKHPLLPGPMDSPIHSTICRL